MYTVRGGGEGFGGGVGDGVMTKLSDTHKLFLEVANVKSRCSPGKLNLDHKI